MSTKFHTQQKCIHEVTSSHTQSFVHPHRTPYPSTSNWLHRYLNQPLTLIFLPLLLSTLNTIGMKPPAHRFIESGVAHTNSTLTHQFAVSLLADCTFPGTLFWDRLDISMPLFDIIKLPDQGIVPPNTYQ